MDSFIEHLSSIQEPSLLVTVINVIIVIFAVAGLIGAIIGAAIIFKSYFDTKRNHTPDS